VKLTLGLTAALLFCAATAHAQTPSVGVRVGVNVANLDFSEETEITDAKTLTGLVAGLFVTVPINDIVGFQPEVLFSQQGTRFTELGETAKFKLDYVQVPLLGRFRLGSGSPVAVLVGPTLGFRYRAKIDAPGVTDDFSDEFEDSIETFDAGLVTGVAVEAGRLVLDGRYTWGLMNIAKDDEFGAGTAKNRVFSASVGFRF
jgi:hypothetical protein